jgi:hypothetical protein
MAKKKEVASAERLAAEGGIALDESAVAVPEIVANEGPVEEHEKEPDASVVWEVGDGEAGCPIEMGSDVDLITRICGRKLHAPSHISDVKPVCLMHSKDPRKKSGRLFDEFFREFERTLDEAGEGEANFTRFVFPQLDFKGWKFQAICHFTGTTFTQDADFSHANFTQNATFSDACFTQDANFSEATFTQDAGFWRTTFMQDANFFSATFKKNADFFGATFTQGGDFFAATFDKDADFLGAVFKHIAQFSATTFRQNAEFRSASFASKANFFHARFMGGTEFSQKAFSDDVNFGSVVFSRNIDLSRFIFPGKVTFEGAKFSSEARFEDTDFHKNVSWRNCRFLAGAEFRNIRFQNPDADGPSAVFALAYFSKPRSVVFDGINLTRVLFHLCDISRCTFTPSVIWGERDGNRGLLLFDEELLFRQGDASQEFPELKPESVAATYQQLKKYYDSKVDYGKGNNFHYGEMEMRLLAGPTSGRLLRLRQWWHRNLSFVAWYKYASDYGNSYRKPLLWLLGILLAAALLFPVTGLELKQSSSANSARVTYGSVWDRQNSWANNFWAEAKLIGKSGITAIDTATFQRTPEYAPVYPWGRVVGIIETLLTSSLFALFLLAIRRQFRR